MNIPSEFSITLGKPDSRTATHELVVPRSIPTQRLEEVVETSLFYCVLRNVETLIIGWIGICLVGTRRLMNILFHIFTII